MRHHLIFITAALDLLTYFIDSTVAAIAFPNLIREGGI